MSNNVESLNAEKLRDIVRSELQAFSIGAHNPVSRPNNQPSQFHSKAFEQQNYRSYNNRNQNNRQQYQRRPQRGSCYLCGEFTHYKANCPLNKAQPQQSQTVDSNGSSSSNDTNITLDQVSLYNEVVIAEINDEVLLGMDILKGKDGKPADIILSQSKIILNGHEINCQHYPQICDRKVRAAEDYNIQGHTEQIIDAFVERCKSDDSLSSSDFIVEPSRNFIENFPLVMAPCLIDINYAPTVKVRVMNPFLTEASIKVLKQ